MSFLLLYGRRGSFSYSTARAHLATLKGMSALRIMPTASADKGTVRVPPFLLHATALQKSSKLTAITPQLAIVSSSRTGDRPVAVERTMRGYYELPPAVY
jgi:hypothetical protein